MIFIKISQNQTAGVVPQPASVLLIYANSSVELGNAMALITGDDPPILGT